MTLTLRIKAFNDVSFVLKARVPALVRVVPMDGSVNIAGSHSPAWLDSVTTLAPRLWPTGFLLRPVRLLSAEVLSDL
jgi:hypothetical protein